MHLCPSLQHRHLVVAQVTGDPTKDKYNSSSGHLRGYYLLLVDLYAND